MYVRKTTAVYLTTSEQPTVKSNRAMKLLPPLLFSRFQWEIMGTWTTRNTFTTRWLCQTHQKINILNTIYMTSSLVFYPHKNQNQNHNLTFIMTRNATALKKKSLALHNVNYYGKFTAARAFHFNTLLQNWFNFNNYNILQRASAPELRSVVKETGRLRWRGLVRWLITDMRRTRRTSYKVLGRITW